MIFSAALFFSLCSNKSFYFRLKNKTLESIINVQAFSHLSAAEKFIIYYYFSFVHTDLVEVRRMDFEKNVKGRHINCRRKENWRHSYEESQVFKTGFD